MPDETRKAKGRSQRRNLIEETSHHRNVMSPRGAHDTEARRRVNRFVGRALSGFHLLWLKLHGDERFLARKSLLKSSRFGSGSKMPDQPLDFERRQGQSMLRGETGARIDFPTALCARKTLRLSTSSGPNGIVYARCERQRIGVTGSAARETTFVRRGSGPLRRRWPSRKTTPAR